MKMKVLLVVVAALVPFTGACALTRTLDGTGEAILLPYYHAADGEATLFGVTNHSDQAKAVRVVIAEGRNGRAALAFNVYLAPRDSWNGAIAGGNQGRPVFFNADESCTLPLAQAAGEPLRDDGYIGSRNDDLGTDVARLQHGSIELIELGVPTGLAAQLVESRQCGVLAARFAQEDGAWRFNPNADIDPPAGGLTGEAQIIDVAGGVAYRSDAVVLDDFSFGPRHALAGNADFNAVRFYKPTVSPAIGGFSVHGAMISIDRPADAVSLTLMSTAYETGYLLGDALDASTRVVVALPTRAAYLDNLPGGELPANTGAIAPFNGVTANKPYCIDSDWQSIDRAGLVSVKTLLPLCEQVNVIDLAQQQGEAGDFVTGSDTGRVRIDLQPHPHTLQYEVFNGDVTEPHQAHGLPAVVQSLSEVRNANAQPGVLASYAISHRPVRETDYDTEF